MVLAGWYIGGLRCNVELTISHANSEKCILYPQGIKVNRAYYGDYRNKRPLFPTIMRMVSATWNLCSLVEYISPWFWTNTYAIG